MKPYRYTKAQPRITKRTEHLLPPPLPPLRPPSQQEGKHMPVKKDYEGLRADFDGLRKRARDKLRDAVKQFENSQFKSDVALTQRKEVIARHQQDTLIGCNSLSEEVAAAAKEADRAYFAARYPSLSSTDPAQKQYGATEFNSAQLVGELYPLDLIRDAYEAGRVDFASALIERALSQPKPTSVDGLYQRHEFTQAVSQLYGERLDKLEADRRGLKKLVGEVQEFTERVRSGYDVDVLPIALQEAYPPGHPKLVDKMLDRIDDLKLGD